MSEPDRDEKYAAAKKRVEDIKNFYVHLLVFVLVISGLILADIYDDKPWWVQWVVIGWGAGVIAHAAQTYGSALSSGKSWSAEWEEKKIRELMDDK